MPELWARAPDATNRKLRELYMADQSAVTRKLKELWARDAAAVNRKIFSSGIKYSSALTYHNEYGSQNVNGPGSRQIEVFGIESFYTDGESDGFDFTFENCEAVEVKSINLHGLYSTWAFSGSPSYPDLTYVYVIIYEASTSTQVGVWNSAIPKQPGNYSFADATINLTKSLPLTNLKMRCLVEVGKYGASYTGYSTKSFTISLTIPSGGIILKPYIDEILLI